MGQAYPLHRKCCAITTAQSQRKMGREGDWVCSGCGNRNYAFRCFCNRCKQPRLLVDNNTPSDSKWLPRIGDWICTGIYHFELLLVFYVFFLSVLSFILSMEKNDSSYVFNCAKSPIIVNLLVASLA